MKNKIITNEKKKSLVLSIIGIAVLFLVFILAQYVKSSQAISEIFKVFDDYISSNPTLAANIILAVLIFMAVVVFIHLAMQIYNFTKILMRYIKVRKRKRRIEFRKRYGYIPR